MDRRRAAGLLLALAACIAKATAAPTASNHTSLDLYDGAPDGCYYNFQHYGEGDRIMTNEPCLNCTCHNRMLMCYLRVCPFTKPIGQDCTIEKRADQCCPIVTCPDVPVDLLTSTTTSPAEYGSTGIGKLDKFGCSINGKYFSEGSKVPPTPNKPCEHCYCIRNMTTCVMQECTLHVDGCTPIYHKDVCCPVRYSCDHPEDEMPLLDDLSTTVRPTPGFLLTTTTISPVTQMTQDCVYDNRVFPDGALIKTEKACDHCYCMKGDIVCVVQECGTPMENEGKNCTALPPRDGVCCPDTYICEGDEPTTGTYYDSNEFTTEPAKEELTTLTPPRRTSSEGSGYRNEPDEVPYSEPDIEGSGEEEEPKQPSETISSPTPDFTEDILASTEETHEYIPLTTSKPEKSPEITTVKFDEIEDKVTSDDDVRITLKPQEFSPSTISEESVTEEIQSHDIGSGELPDDEIYKPGKDTTETTVLPNTDENIVTTEIKDDSILTTKITDRVPYESEMVTISSLSQKDITTSEPIKNDVTITDVEDSATSKLPSGVTENPALEASTRTPSTTEQSMLVENEDKVTTEISEEIGKESTVHPSSTSAPSIDDEYVTTETQEQELVVEKGTERIELQHHITASTPMLEEIEKDTTEYIEPEHMIPDDLDERIKPHILSTTTSSIPLAEDNTKDTSEDTILEEYVTEDIISHSTNVPVFDHEETTTVEPEISDQKDMSQPEPSSTNVPTTDDNGRRTEELQPSTITPVDSKVQDIFTSPIATEAESEVTTEPDKGLNTIPSDIIDEVVSVSTETKTTSVADETLTTESSADSIISPSKPKEEQPIFTTESAFRKEDYSPTESQEISDVTTVTADVTKEVISTLTHDAHTESTEVVSSDKEISSTLQPQFTEIIQETTMVKEDSEISGYEDTTSRISELEKDHSVAEETVTSTPSLNKLPETTTANQEDNEIFNEPRIPGEGDCLLNGVRYINESTVPSTNKCQSGCKCISSIVKCDPIICSPPPEYMNNCETVYDSPDSCCPTYICDHKTETIPPQSHSQMSGTEAPISPIQCHGDECEINKEHHDPSSDACKSGGCDGQSEISQDTSSGSPTEVPIKPVIDQKIDCIDEKGCQAIPAKPCNGEDCLVLTEDITPHIPESCEGKDCKDTQSPTDQCNSADCGSSDIKPEKCNGNDCQDTTTVSEEKCKGENCKEVDSSSPEETISQQCNEPGCKQLDQNIDVTTMPILEQHDQDKKKEVPKEEITEKSESETTELPNDIIDDQKDITSDESTTLSEGINLEVTTESFESQHQDKNVDIEPEKNIPDIIKELEDTSTPLSVPVSSEIPDESTQAESSEDLGTTLPSHVPYEETTAHKLDSSTELPVIDTTELQKITKSPEVLENDNLDRTIETTSTNPQVDENETESITKLPISEDFEDQNITMPLETYETTEKDVQESSTLSSQDIELPKVTGSSEMIIPSEDKEKSTEKTLTEITLSLDDFTKEIQEESKTEPSTTIEHHTQKFEPTVSEDGSVTRVTVADDYVKHTEPTVEIESYITTEKMIEDIDDLLKPTSTKSEDVTKSSEEIEQSSSPVTTELSNSDKDMTEKPNVIEPVEPVSQSVDIDETTELTMSNEIASTLSHIDNTEPSLNKISTETVSQETSTKTPDSKEENESTKSETEKPHLETSTTSEGYFTESSIYSTTGSQDISTTLNENDQQKATLIITDEPSTKSPELYQTEEAYASSDKDFEGTTENIMEPSITEETLHVSEENDVTSMVLHEVATEPSILPESVGSVITTEKVVEENFIKPDKTSDNIEKEADTDSTSQDHTITDSDREDSTTVSTITGISEKEKESETAQTTTPKILVSDLTTSVPLEASIITTSDIEKAQEMTIVTEYGIESSSQSTEISKESEFTENEQRITTPLSTKYDITTNIPEPSDYEAEKEIPSKPDLGTQTTVSPVTSHVELDMFSSQKPDVTTISDRQSTKSDNDIPDFETADELRTTSSEPQDVNPISNPTTEPSQEPDKSSKYPGTSDTTQKDENELTLPENTPQPEIQKETEITDIPEEEIKPENPSTTVDTSFTEKTITEPNAIDTSSENKPTTEKETNIDDLSLKTTTDLYDTTKAEEEIHLLDPTYHDTKEPETPVDVQSLVTEQTATSIEISDLEKGTHSTNDADTSQSVEPETVTISSIESSYTTIKQSDEKSETVEAVDHIKPIDDIAQTEPPISKDKTELTTNRIDITTAIDEKIETTNAVITEKQQFDISTETSFVDEHKSTTELSYTTEINIVEDQYTPVSENDYTKSEHHLTTVIENQVKDSETTTMSSSSFKPEKEHVFIETTEKSSIQTESNAVEMSTSEPMVTLTPTPKHTQFSISTSPDEGSTTETIKETESDHNPLPEISSVEETQTVATEKETLAEEYGTTKQQLESEIYHTTSPTLEESPEKSTTAAQENIKPTLQVEQSTPTSISETERLSTLEASIPVQTEKVISATEKPLQETTAPEEEFLVATSKPTTSEADKEISTLSPVTDRTITEKPEDISVSAAGDASITTTTSDELHFEEHKTDITEEPTNVLAEATTTASESPIESSSVATTINEPEKSVTTASELPTSVYDNTPATVAPKEPITIKEPEDSIVTIAPEVSTTSLLEESVTTVPKVPTTVVPEAPLTTPSEESTTTPPAAPVPTEIETLTTNTPEELITNAPEVLVTVTPERATLAPEEPTLVEKEEPITTLPEAPATIESEPQETSKPEIPGKTPPEVQITTVSTILDTKTSETLITKATEAPTTKAPEPSVTPPEIPKPVSTEAQPIDEVPAPDEEGSFPPSGGTSGYGQEPDYMEEDQTFGPGTCRYGGKVYVSAQQIPRDDPCDFCFCFRSDIICLQQSCPPPIHGCHEEPIQGFCCPRYECPVSMATTVNVTTTTTTTTTTLPPHFPTHSYKGSAQRQGCQIKGQIYKVGEVVRASSGPCLHCTCGGDGQMKCDPKVCTPEPMLRQMIAAAVSAKRRR